MACCPRFSTSSTCVQLSQRLAHAYFNRKGDKMHGLVSKRIRRLSLVCAAASSVAGHVGCGADVESEVTTGDEVTWRAQTSGTGDDIYGASFVDEMNGWLATSGGVLATKDGGKNWTTSFVGSGYPFTDVNFVDNMTGWAVSDYGVYRTNDGGTTWGVAAEAGLRLAARTVTMVSVATAQAPPQRYELSRAVHQRKYGDVVYIPAGFWTTEGGNYDLIIHFHGGANVVEPQLLDSGLNAVLVTLNVGLSSRPYRERFRHAKAFTALLATVQEIVEQHGPASGKASSELGRVALSSWSAGYGAVGTILSHESLRDGIDAVFLADGVHASFDGRFHRKIFEGALDPYVAFAKRAVNGDKLLGLTHSQILTYGYASTTETARELITSLSLKPCSPSGPDGMKALSCNERGNFRVRGFAGNDKDAHCRHVLNMDELVLRPLKARWDGSAGAT